MSLDSSGFGKGFAGLLTVSMLGLWSTAAHAQAEGEHQTEAEEAPKQARPRKHPETPKDTEAGTEAESEKAHVHVRKR
jgi:hypothetical protein